MINLVLFGKPGAGKGTQAVFLKKRYNLLHISTGDLFRYNIKNETALANPECLEFFKNISSLKS